MSDPTTDNAPSRATTDPPPAVPRDFFDLPADADPESRAFLGATRASGRSILSHFLEATGLSGPEFMSLPATHLEFLGRQLLRAQNEETRVVGEYSCEQMADGSAHISCTFPPGGLDRVRGVLAGLGEVLLPALMSLMQDAMGKAAASEPPKRKRRSRKTPAAAPSATPTTGQAPLDLGGAK